MMRFDRCLNGTNMVLFSNPLEREKSRKNDEHKSGAGGDDLPKEGEREKEGVLWVAQGSFFANWLSAGDALFNAVKKNNKRGHKQRGELKKGGDRDGLSNEGRAFQMGEDFDACAV